VRARCCSGVTGATVIKLVAVVVWLAWIQFASASPPR
jgi:hypothetical protein